VRRGWIDEQLAASRALYRRKSELTLAALERWLGARARWTTPCGGFFTWVTLPVDTTDLAQRAVDAGVAVIPGTLFYADGRGADAIRLSFSMVDESLIASGIERLAALLAR
jgi:2-aminoadipate transaminase